MAATNLKRWLLTAALTATLAVMAAAQSTTTGGGIPSCASKLAGCAEYLNATTKPPKTCCDPLNEALTNEKNCLCGLYKNPDLLKTFGVNVTQAMNLPKLCKLAAGQSSNFCQDAAKPPTSSGSGSSGSGSGSGSSSGSKSAAVKSTGTGLVSSILLIVGACLFFY